MGNQNFRGNTAIGMVEIQTTISIKTKKYSTPVPYGTNLDEAGRILKRYVYSHYTGLPIKKMRVTALHLINT